MKPPRFDYAAPATLDEAVALLARSNGGAKVISGGQSLMPLLAFRLAAPDMLVDLKRIPGLDTIEIGITGTVTLGARVRWVDIEKNAKLATVQPSLAEAIKHVAHYQIRNRGTVGGSVAHADPAAEMPGITVACDATIVAMGADGARRIKAGDFFLGPLQTALEPDEIITSIEFPLWTPARRWAFLEFARRRGDFALAGVAVFYDPDANGKATNVHIGVIGMGDKPRRLSKAEAALEGQAVDETSIAAAARTASAEVDPSGDIHAGPEYRRALVGTLLERALRKAAG